jgi:hypothetical protein
MLLATIGKLLGHELPETTAKYAHLADETIADAAARVGLAWPARLDWVHDQPALRQVVEKALAEVGVDPKLSRAQRGRPRTTTWLAIENGFGIRHYASGRHVYIVQTRMGGRVRTITIGPATVLTRHQATMVARRVIAHARVGHDPATVRERIRSAPRMDDFLRNIGKMRADGNSRRAPRH